MKRRRDRQNPSNKPKIVKSLPLAIAVAALSSATAFAAAPLRDVDEIDVYTDTGVFVTVDITRFTTDVGYANSMKALLRSRYLGYHQVLLHDDSRNEWADLNADININNVVIENFNWWY